MLRQQASPDVGIGIFTGDPVNYHYFIAVLNEVIEKIGNLQHRVTRLIKSTDD